ncbi:MAG: LuxR C-terminal-related transcriptional regulator [Gammaproteobacteria bacterium]|nr:LuxR C-terminal-related transcriptional regulator [Gammaproteobacteria bacterium]
MNRPDPVPAWLLAHRASVPEPPQDYCDRPALAARCDPLRRPVTVLMAPGGFGKTTALAAACRTALAARVPVAWLTLADDDADTLDAYLALAFARAGLDVHAATAEHGPAQGSPAPRTDILLRAVEARGRPFVLALDELENLARPDAVAVLDRLLDHAPPCLHLALAYRALPAGLGAARRVLDDASVVTADDLRFDKPDIARFFDLTLSRDRIAAVAAESGGWPIALRMRRNAPDDPPAAALRDAVGNWIGAGFWRAFPTADRRLALDLSLFDWIDRDLVDEALESPGAFDRAAALPGLAGLLTPAAGGPGGVHRLHPLLREHGASALRRERPAHARRLGRRIARALARRGATLDAMRQAVRAGDAHLAGTILLDAGGVQWWLREGAGPAMAADRLLAERTVARHPRLALFRSVALHLAARPNDAARLFERTEAKAPCGDAGFDIDRLLARGFLEYNGVRATDAAEWRTTLTEAVAVAVRPSAPRIARAGSLYGRAANGLTYARFGAAVESARRGRALAAGESRFLTMLFDCLLAQQAMLRGRPKEARRHADNARRIVPAGFLHDPQIAAYTKLAVRELDVERSRAEHEAEDRRTALEMLRGGYDYTRYAAATDVAVALETDARGAAAALDLVEELAERARASGIGYLAPLLTAHRVALLADAGRAGEADTAWRAAELPDADAACVDIDGRGWRCTEAIACARIRLLGATGEPARAAELEQALAHAAERHGLCRTLMRSLALRVRLAHEARDTDGAHAAADEYLNHYARADYARPLLATGAATATLERVLDADPSGPRARHARRLLAMAGAEAAGPVRLDGQEMKVLRLLATHTNKEIGRAMGLSPDGARHHLRKIFAKLGVRRRLEAVRRATDLGLLPERPSTSEPPDSARDA